MSLEKEIQWFDELRPLLQTKGRLAWDALRKELVGKGQCEHRFVPVEQLTVKDAEICIRCHCVRTSSGT